MYNVNYPRVEIARAANKCRLCGRVIKKGSKYLCTWFIDREQLIVTNRGRSRIPISKKMKYCSSCADSLLNLDPKEFILGNKHKQKVTEAIKELLPKFVKSNRYDIARTNINPI